MITEDYCSYEVAKLLKEKGFNGEIHTTFDKEGYTQPSITHQMAIKWLREVYNIFIQVKRDNQYYEGTPVTPITEHDKKRGHSSEYYAVVLDAKSNSNSFEHFDRYEEAVEAALKYSLKNLI